MLNAEPGREDEVAYWARSLALNRTLMSLIEDGELPYEPELSRRPLPASLRRAAPPDDAGEGERVRQRRAAFQS